VQETNNEQLLRNILRVYGYESPVFTSVVERDFQASTAGGIMGGSSTIGAIPALGILPDFHEGWIMKASFIDAARQFLSVNRGKRI
jgi:hypothetical protein